MDKSRFSILEAVKNAYVFVGKEWLYLLKAGLLPMGAQAATALFIQFQHPDASQIEGYLWGLPTTVLFAWFMFLQTRLLLLGERLDRLPKDPAGLADRLHAMKLSVMTALLFNMGTAAALTLLLAAEESGQWGTNWPVTMGGFFLLGGIFWGVRFGIVPILAAVHYPIRPVLRQTWGMMFSLRLMGMGIACVLPVALLFQLIIAATVTASAEPGVTVKLTAAEQITVIVASAPLSLIAAALLNAAAAYALKQLLGAKRNGTIA